jgi:hypothetical protein
MCRERAAVGHTDLHGTVSLLVAALKPSGLLPCSQEMATESYHVSKSELTPFRLLLYDPFLGAFAKLRKATISSVMSVRPSTLIQLGSYWTDFHEVFEYFSKICRENPSLIKIRQV